MCKRVFGHGKTYCGIHLMIQGILITLMPQKGVFEEPWRLPHYVIASFEQNIIPYILYTVLKLYLKGYWGKIKLLVASI